MWTGSNASSLFHHKRHPQDLGPAEITAFLIQLAVHDNVAASTQSQALNALVFLYRHVLQHALDGPLNLVRAKKPERLPVVLTRDEAQAILRCLSGEHQLMAKLLYGSGLRLMECVRLRVKLVLSLPKETSTSPSTRLVLSPSKYCGARRQVVEHKRSLALQSLISISNL